MGAWLVKLVEVAFLKYLGEWDTDAYSTLGLQSLTTHKTFIFLFSIATPSAAAVVPRCSTAINNAEHQCNYR